MLAASSLVVPLRAAFLSVWWSVLPQTVFRAAAYNTTYVCHCAAGTHVVRRAA